MAWMLLPARAWVLPPPLTCKRIQCFTKTPEITERFVHGRKTHVGDLIKPPQVLEHKIANRRGAYLRLPEELDIALNARDELAQLIGRNRPALERTLEPAKQLFTAIELVASVAFDHRKIQDSNFLKRGKAEAASLPSALATTPNRDAIARYT